MEKNIKRLLRDLSNPDDDLRALSAMTLMKVDLPDVEARNEVIHALMKATKDKNVSVRFFSRKAIDKFRQNNDAENQGGNELSLDKALESEDYRNRLSAVMQIAKEGRTDFKDRFINMLKVEKHDFVKAGLISGLKKFLAKEDAGILSPFLTDPDSRVRSNAIEALEFLKAEEAIPNLFPSLEDPDNRIRAVAAKALQSFGEEKVFAVLKKMLNSGEEWMKFSAIYSLSHINAGESILLLLDAAKSQIQPETRIKAIIALANYNDLTSYGFLKHTQSTAEEPFRSTAAKSLRLFEEKFGYDPPKSTLVVQEDNSKSPAQQKKGKGSGEPTDLAGTVSKFFRMGKEEAVGLSPKSAISFSVTDLKKEQIELLKEGGRVVFEIYQQGDLNIPELLTISHEILKMNFFIQKYSEEEEKVQPEATGGFFAQLKNFFVKPPPKNPKVLQAEKYTQKREELFQKLGEASFRKFRTQEFTPAPLEGYFQTYESLEAKIRKEHEKTSK